MASHHSFSQNLQKQRYQLETSAHSLKWVSQVESNKSSTTLKNKRRLFYQTEGLCETWVKLKIIIVQSLWNMLLVDTVCLEVTRFLLYWCVNLCGIRFAKNKYCYLKPFFNLKVKLALKTTLKTTFKTCATSKIVLIPSLNSTSKTLIPHFF